MEASPCCCVMSQPRLIERSPCNSAGFSACSAPPSGDPEPPGKPRTCPQDLPHGRAPQSAASAADVLVGSIGSRSNHSARVRSRPATRHAKRATTQGPIGQRDVFRTFSITRSPRAVNRATGTEPSSSGKASARRLCVRGFQRVALPSSELATNSRPSGEKEMASTGPVATSTGAPTGDPSAGSQRTTFPSSVPAAKRRPSGENAIEVA